VIDDFPRMIYHVVEEPKIVQNADEMKMHLDRGWSRTPQTFSEVNAIRAKIAYHQAEAERLADKLIELEDAQEEALTVTDEERFGTAVQEPKKPGRPKKKAA
jgi:hypothetical protein